MQTVRWSDEATTDLVEIIDYIEQRNAIAAKSLLAAIMLSAQSLPLMPYLFRLGRVTTSTPQLCQSGIGNQPRRLLLLLQTTRSWRSIGPFDSPMAESARLMPVTASPMPAHAGAIAGLIS